MEFLYEARKWATDRGFDLPISNFLPHLGSIDNEDFNDTRPNAIHASPHRSEKRPEHSSPHGRLPSSLHGRAPTLSLSSPVPPMPPHSPTTTSKSTSRVSVNHPFSTRTPPHSGSSRVESHSTQHQQDMDFEMRRKIEFNNANAMRSMNNNNNSINNSSSSSIMYSTMDVDSGGVSLNRQGIDALASHSHSGEPLSSSRSSSSSSVSGPSQAELLNSARQRALAAEQRCIELESVVENYARQGAGLEALAKDLNQTVNQQIVDVTEEAREAKMRAFKAESELNGANEQLIKTLSELEEMKKVILNVQAEADEAKAETEAMRRRAESQIEEIKRAVTDHAEQISTEAQAAVYQAKRAMDEAIREAERVREREAAAKADASTAQSRIATLLEDFEIMRMEAQALKSSSQTSESQLAEAREEIERLRSRLLKVETQAAAAATASTTVRATPSSDNNHYQQQHNLSIESSSSETRGNDSSSYSISRMSSKQESLSDHSDHATMTLTSSVTNSVTRKDNQTNSLSTSSAPPSFSSLSSVRQVVVHITDPDAPSLLPRPQHSRGANNAKGTKDAGATLSVLNRNEVMVMDGEDSMSFSAHVVAGGHLAKGGEHAANLNRMLSSISESVVNGGRSSAIFLGSAPSLGDAPFQSLSSAASAALFSVIEKSNEREGGVVQRSVGVGLVEVGPATTTLKHSTNKAPNDGLEDEVRDILDAYSSKGASADGEYNVVGCIDDARLVAPVISPYLGSDDDDLSPTSSSLSPIVSRAASVVVTGSEGVDVVVELALRNRANIRAFGTPESASTIEAALLLMRTHAVLTLSVTHSTPGGEEGSFVSRLHIVHLACPGHIGAIEQINATPPLLPRALYQGAMAESNRASKTLSALASAWNALESSSSRSGGNNHDDLAGRLEIDTFVNNCVLTNVISDALQPASPLLFLVEIPPILNRFADLDAAVSFLSTASAAASFLSTASDVTKGLSKGGRNNLAVLALETQLQQNRLLNRYLSAQAQPQPSSNIVIPASSNPAPARRHSTVNTPVVSTNNSSNPQRDFVRSGTGTGGGGLHAVWDPIIRRPSTSSSRRKSQSAVDDVSMLSQINSFTTPKAANRSSSSSSSTTLTSFGSSTATISSHRNTLSGAGATPFRDPSSRVTQKKPAVPRLSGAASHTYRQASSIAPSGHSQIMTTSTPRFDDIDAAIEQELMDATAMRQALLREKQLGQTQPLHSSIAKKQNNSSVSAGQGQQQQQPLLYNNAKQTEDLYVNDEPDPVPGMRAILQIASESGGLRPSSFDTLRAMLSSSDVYGYGKVTPRAFAQGLSRWLPNLGIERATGIVASMGIVDEGGDDSNVKEDGVDYEDFVTAVQSLWEQSSM